MLDSMIIQRNEVYKQKQINLNENKQNYKLNLRKKTINKIIEKKRLQINSEEDLEFSKKPAKLGNIDLTNLNIPEEYKFSNKIREIIHKISNEEIFNFINEIYNLENYNGDKLIYGLSLLNYKLDKEDKSYIVLDDILKRNFSEIIEKLLKFSKKEIQTNDEDDKLLDLTYCILINFSFHGNKDECEFLIKEQFLEYHYFFLEKSSNDEIINNIIIFLNNLCITSQYFANLIFSYKEEIFLKLLNDYIISSLNTKKTSLLKQIVDLYDSYLKNWKGPMEDSNEFPVNISICENLFKIFCELINIDATFEKSVWGLGFLHKILYKYNHLNELSEMILFQEAHLLYFSITGFEYDQPSYNENDDSPLINLIPACQIIKYLFKTYNDIEDSNVKRLLSEKIEFVMKKCFILDIFENLFKEGLSSLIAKTILITIRYIALNDNYYMMILENKSLIQRIINFVYHEDYKLRKKALKILKILSEHSALQLNSTLMKLGIFPALIKGINPYNIITYDVEILLPSLDIILNILKNGEILSFIGRNNYLYNFENLGGKEILEKLLGNPNDEVYKKTEFIIDTFFANKIN